MDAEQDRVRPGPLRWIWYAMGGALPARNSTWVLHDTTCRTWVLRYIARATVQISPLVAAVILFIPAALNVRVLTAVGTGLPSILFAMFFAVPGNENRLAKAGYPAGIGERIRTERSTRSQVEANRLRRERIAARRARRRA